MTHKEKLYAVMDRIMVDEREKGRFVHEKHLPYLEGEIVYYYSDSRYFDIKWKGVEINVAGRVDCKSLEDLLALDIKKHIDDLYERVCGDKKKDGVK